MFYLEHGYVASVSISCLARHVEAHSDVSLFLFSTMIEIVDLLRYVMALIFVGYAPG